MFASRQRDNVEDILSLCCGLKLVLPSTNKFIFKAVNKHIFEHLGKHTSEHCEYSRSVPQSETVLILVTTKFL